MRLLKGHTNEVRGEDFDIASHFYASILCEAEQLRQVQFDRKK